MCARRSNHCRSSLVSLHARRRSCVSTYAHRVITTLHKPLGQCPTAAASLTRRVWPCHHASATSLASFFFTACPASLGGCSAPSVVPPRHLRAWPSVPLRFGVAAAAVVVPSWFPAGACWPSVGLAALRGWWFGVGSVGCAPGVLGRRPAASACLPSRLSWLVGWACRPGRRCSCCLRCGRASARPSAAGHRLAGPFAGRLGRRSASAFSAACCASVVVLAGVLALLAHSRFKVTALSRPGGFPSPMPLGAPLLRHCSMARVPTRCSGPPPGAATEPGALRHMAVHPSSLRTGVERRRDACQLHAGAAIRRSA